MIFSLVITLILLIINGIYCDVKFQYIDSEQCIDQPVEYNCTVTGSGLQALTWRIYHDDGTQIGSDVTYTSVSDQDPATRGVFTVQQLSKSPLISNISFTVQSSINGYTIVCADGNTLSNENITINIIGPPPPPVISIQASVNQQSSLQLHITWTPPSYPSQCVNIASYSVASPNGFINTTDTSVTILVDGHGIYNVSVATIDTANRIGEYSNKTTVEFKIPECGMQCDVSPKFISSSNTAKINLLPSSDMILDSIMVSWEFVENVHFMLTDVYLYHNVSGVMNPLNPSLDIMGNYTFNNVTEDTIYTFSVSGKNEVGTGNNCTCQYDPEYTPVTSTPSSTRFTSSTVGTGISTMSSSTVDFSSSLSPSHSVVPDEECNWVCILIVIIVVVCFLIALILIILLISCYLYKRKRSQKRSGVKPATEDERKDKPEDNNNYADLEVIPSANATKKMVDTEKADSKKKSKKSQKMQPSKPKPFQSQPVTKSERVTYAAVKQEVEYADMSHAHGRPGGVKPRHQPPTQSVTYSSIKH